MRSAQNVTSRSRIVRACTVGPVNAQSRLTWESTWESTGAEPAELS
ncbi:hypothetical protein [Parafrankia elaeagni]|nr:hypothetical protein [Parafrankia elaeagni]